MGCLEKTAVLLCIVCAVSATASARSPRQRQVHIVSVGKGDHKFQPETVRSARAGDVIEFQFFPQNHSVVRAEYGHPCVPYDTVNPGRNGFFSGFHPVAEISSAPLYWRIEINDTDPIFFYCSATNSCIGYQMVGVINPNSTVSLQTQKQKAKEAAYMLQPGEPVPAEMNPTKTRNSTSPASTNTTTASSSPSHTTAVMSENHTISLSTGAIIGIAVGGAAFLALGAALFFYLGRSKTLEQEVNRNSTAVARLTPSTPYVASAALWSGSPSPGPSPFSGPQSPGSFSRRSTDPKMAFQRCGGGEAEWRASGYTSPICLLGGPASPMPEATHATLRPQPMCVNENQPQELESPDSRVGR